MMKNVTETSKPDDRCIGSFVYSIMWVRADLDMIARNARSQVLSSCLLGRKQIGDPKMVDGSMSVAFEDPAGKHTLKYDNSRPENAFQIN